MDDRRQEIESADAGGWKEVFFDPCDADWRERWALDGRVGTARNGPEGMELTAGPEFRNSDHHVVLWTRASFSGDVRIEFEYTRLDSATRCVNILYVQATGSGQGPYARDVGEWAALRATPAMELYYNHMHAYHISFAAYPDDYIRARRCMPEANGLDGTDLSPDASGAGFFKSGAPHRLTAIKRGDDLFLRVRNEGAELHHHWRNDKLPPIAEGRIGLRHMFTRSARYRDFRIAVREG